MVRLLFFAVLIYLLLRLVRRVVHMLSLKSSVPRSSEDSEFHRTGAPSGGVIDEMKRCPTCRTYNPTRLTYRKKDLYFCSERCHEDFIRRESNP